MENVAKNDINEILEFVVHLGKEMLLVGTSLERVNMTALKLCHRYGLKEVSMHGLSTSLTLSAKDRDGNFAIRQLSVPAAGINLGMMRRLNSLVFKVSKELPSSSLLMGMLKEAVNVTERAWWIRYLGYLGAMTSLCRIFNGSWPELLAVLINTSILFFATMLLSKANINKVISNFVLMFTVTSLGLFWTFIGFVGKFWSVVIVGAFFLMPGVPMVNAVRNIFCGNEMNGIIGLLKVLIEVLAMVGGICAAFAVFGGFLHESDTAMEDSINTGTLDLLHSIEVTVLSFTASFSFGIVFKSEVRDWAVAGIGGGIVRIVYLSLKAVTTYRIVFTLVAAFAAALYAEIIALARKEPGTIYLYPSIIPLIPGDLLYYTVLGIIWNNQVLFAQSGEVVVQLIAMCSGFVLCSTVMHYVKKIKFTKILKNIENSLAGIKEGEHHGKEETAERK